MVNGPSLIEYYSDNIIYDSMTGRLFTIDKCARDAIQSEIQSQGKHPATYRSKEEAQIRALLKEKQNSGILIDRPLSGYVMPEVRTIADIEIREVTFEVTEQCNLRCAYCYYDKGNSLSERRSHSPSALAIDVVDTALEYLRPLMNKNTAIGFYGGEPLLNIRMVKYILDRIRAVLPDWTGLTTLTSNFTVLNPEIEEVILQNKIVLLLSLDGPREIHDKNRLTKSGAGTYERIMNNLARLAARNPTFCKERVTTHTVLSSPDMFDRLDGFFREFPIKILGHNFSPVVVSSHHSEIQNNGYSTKDIQIALDNWAIAQLTSVKDIYDIRRSPLLLFYCKQMLRDFHNRSIADASRLRSFRSCIPGHKIFVHTNGNLSVCEKCDSLIIGTVDSGLDLRKIRTIIDNWIALLGEDCLSCPATAFCRACYLHGWTIGAFSISKLRRFCRFFVPRAARLFPVFLDLLLRIPNLPTLMDEESEMMIG